MTFLLNYKDFVTFLSARLKRGHLCFMLPFPAGRGPPDKWGFGLAAKYIGTLFPSKIWFGSQREHFTAQMFASLRC